MVLVHSDSLIDPLCLKNMRSVAMVKFSLLIYIACQWIIQFQGQKYVFPYGKKKSHKLGSR